MLVITPTRGLLSPRHAGQRRPAARVRWRRRRCRRPALSAAARSQRPHAGALARARRRAHRAAREHRHRQVRRRAHPRVRRPAALSHRLRRPRRHEPRRPDAALRRQRRPSWPTRPLVPEARRHGTRPPKLARCRVRHSRSGTTLASHSRRPGDRVDLDHKGDRYDPKRQRLGTCGVSGRGSGVAVSRHASTSDNRVVSSTGAGLIARGLTGYCPVNERRPSLDRADTRVALAGDRGVHVDESIVINRPPAELFRFWRDLSNLPRFMEHLDVSSAVTDPLGLDGAGADRHARQVGGRSHQRDRRRAHWLAVDRERRCGNGRVGSIRARHPRRHGDHRASAIRTTRRQARVARRLDVRRGAVAADSLRPPAPEGDSRKRRRPPSRRLDRTVVGLGHARVVESSALPVRPWSMRARPATTSSRRAKCKRGAIAGARVRRRPPSCSRLSARSPLASGHGG